MNKKWWVIFLLVIWGVGCNVNSPSKKDISQKEFLPAKTINEDELKKFITNYPVIVWKKSQIKENKKIKIEEKQSEIDNFVKELGYESTDEFNRIWMVLSTFQSQLNYKNVLEKRLANLYITKEEKNKIKEEVKIMDKIFESGLVREDLPRVDIKLVEKYYQELKKLKITNLINGS
ncbi:hypothetical protein KAI68_02410 [bacterium]|nr:hypothetical protein [bacterium]